MRTTGRVVAEVCRLVIRSALAGGGRLWSRWLLYFAAAQLQVVRIFCRPRNLMCVYDDWFEDDELNSRQQAVVDVVRESARSWPECRPSDTFVLVFGPDEDDQEDVHPAARESRWEPPAEHTAYHTALDEALDRREEVLTLIANLVDRRERERGLIFMTLGATVIGNRLFCSERHSQNYQTPEPTGDVAPLSAAGSPERLGQIAAAWFEEIMNRLIISSHPVVGGGYRFVPPGTALPPGHRGVRNGPL
jgi:hypothetical protein